MRDLMIFLGSNAIAVLVLTRKPSISNKYHMYNFAVLLVTLFISYYLCNKDIKNQEQDISTKKDNEDV